MSYCVCNRSRGIIVWCKQYSSAVMMAKEIGSGSVIVNTRCKFLRRFVAQIRSSWS